MTLWTTHCVVEQKYSSNLKSIFFSKFTKFLMFVYNEGLLNFKQHVVHCIYVLCFFILCFVTVVYNMFKWQERFIIKGGKTLIIYALKFMFFFSLPGHFVWSVAFPKPYVFWNLHDSTVLLEYLRMFTILQWYLHVLGQHLL